MTTRFHLPAVPVALAPLLRARGAEPTALQLLLGTGSMTRALAARHGAVRVEPLREGWTLAAPAEARALERRPGGGFWRREIRLVAGGRERLRGCTLVPPDARPLQRRLARLGARPLMDLLFLRGRLRPGVRRRWQRLALHRDGSVERMTLFAVDGAPLLLRERIPSPRPPAGLQ